MSRWVGLSIVLSVLSGCPAGPTVSVKAIDIVTDAAVDTAADAAECSLPLDDSVACPDGDGSQIDADSFTDTTEDTAPVYPLDDVLRVNHIQAKGTHNSYHVKPVVGDLVGEWQFTHAPLDVQLAEYGVRQVELDIHLNSDGGFDIFHVPVIDDMSTCETFVECLSVIKAWSDSNPGHHILFVLVEPKDDLDLLKISGHYDEVDSAILAVWPAERILTPDDVRGDYDTLRQALEEVGWPTLGETRNKVMFVMLDGGAHRDGYLEGHPTLENRVIFARGGSTEPWAAIVEYGDPFGSKDDMNEKALAGYLVRGDADQAGISDADNAEKALAVLQTGAHFISSDFPSLVDGKDYWFDIQDGSPSRCNPIVAPPECTAAAIENLGSEQ